MTHMDPLKFLQEAYKLAKYVDTDSGILCERCKQRTAVGHFDDDGLWSIDLPALVEATAKDYSVYCQGCADFLMAQAEAQAKEE